MYIAVIIEPNQCRVNWLSEQMSQKGNGADGDIQGRLSEDPPQSGVLAGRSVAQSYLGRQHEATAAGGEPSLLGHCGPPPSRS